MSVPITRKIVDLPNGAKIVMFFLLEDKYKIWTDLQGFYRWSLNQWSDDGVGGISTHGKSMSLRGSVDACVENEAVWRDLVGGHV